MKKILITGGAGFIGSNLCEHFINKGNTIVCLDNFSTGLKSNLCNIIEHPNFTLIEGDIRNMSDCRKAVDGANFVLHQAALGSVPRSISDPLSTNDVNINGFLNMLIASRDAEVKRFVYASSSSIYGDSIELPKVEEIIGKPLSPYAITKFVNELYADVFSKIYGLETIGLRYFNVFGPRQNPNGAYAAVIPLFIKKLIEYKSPIINGNGEYSRDFTYIKNVIEINELAITTQSNAAINKVYNTAVGEQISLNKLVDLLKENLSKYDNKISSVPIEYGENRKGDIPHSLASIEKARKYLGYNPKFTFEQGIKETIYWYFENLK